MVKPAGGRNDLMQRMGSGGKKPGCDAVTTSTEPAITPRPISEITLCEIRVRASSIQVSSIRVIHWHLASGRAAFLSRKIAWDQLRAEVIVCILMLGIGYKGKKKPKNS